MQVILIRHAESKANQDPDLICGRTVETPLSDKGRVQAKDLEAKFRSLYNPIEAKDAIHCSSALRTRETARLAFPDAKLTTSDALLEQSAGIHEGKSRKASYTLEVLKQMESEHVHFQPSEGESISQAGKRLLDYVQSCQEKKCERVVIVTHSMAIKGLLYHTVQLRPESLYLTGVENASITEIRHHPRGWFLVRLNV